MAKISASAPAQAGGKRAGLRRLEVALWCAGLALIAFFIGVRLDASLGKKAALADFEAAKKQAAKPDAVAGLAAEKAVPFAQTLAAYESPDKSLWSPERVRGFDASLPQKFDTLGVLRIPTIGLEVPVLAGTDEIALNRGVGHIEGTPRPGQPGNVGIAGHRDGFFRGLKDIAAGDVLELESLTGTDRYRIESITIVTPDRVDVLAPTETSTVTLVTCFPFYYAGSAPRRYIVHASLDRSAASQIAERRSRAP